MERKDLLLANAQIFSAQGKALDAVANRNVRVLVVGNPANTNALIAQRNAPGPEPAQFHGDGAPRSQPRAGAARGEDRHAHHATSASRSSGAITPRLSIPTCITRSSTASRRCRWSIRSGTRRRSFRPCSSAARPSSRRAAQSSAASAASAAIDHVRDWVHGTAGRRLGQHGRAVRRQLRHSREGVIYWLPRDVPQRRVPDRAGPRGQRVQPRSAWTPRTRSCCEERDGVKELI